MCVGVRVCVCVCVRRLLGQWLLVFVLLGLMLLWVMGTVSGNLNFYRIIPPRLYVWVYKTLRLSPVAVEHSVVAMTAGSQAR